MNSFFTISSPAEGFFKDKGSKFLSFAFPVNSHEEIKSRLDELKSTYHDARHYCYAWVLGLNDQKWRANDDGEPSHSAGDPILGQIKSFNLTNTLVVVVRYFGGTKLGRPGLVNAYKQAAGDALSKAGSEEVFEMISLSVKFGYDDISKVERMIDDLGLQVHERTYTSSCFVKASIRKELKGRLEELLKDHFEIKIEFDGNI